MTHDHLNYSLSPSIWVTGEAFVDLTDVREDKARMRVYAALSDTPAGAQLVLYVGPLAVNRKWST